MSSPTRLHHPDDWWLHEGGEWQSVGALLRDAFGSKLEIVVAEAAQELIGFAAWQPTYDLHHCVPGGEVADMYVVPGRRGCALPVSLMAAVATRVQATGGVFVKGQAVVKPGVQALYERIAISFPGADCIVGGRAFRALAQLADKPARYVVRHLPEKPWNYEA